MKRISKVTVIGAGNMGGAIAGAIASGTALRSEDITVTARTAATLDRIRSLYPEITGFLDNRTAVHGADMLIFAVKPLQLPGVIEEIRSDVDLDNVYIASVVAGVSFRELYDMFGRMPALPVFRIIPNMAASLRKSVTFISSDRENTDSRAQVDRIFRDMGDVIWTDETMLDNGMALASCGIAYAFGYISAAIKGGMSLGFTAEQAREAVIGTVEGAVALLKADGTMPEDEIRKVATPGGYTARGLQAMEDCGFTDAVRAGLVSSSVRKL